MYICFSIPYYITWKRPKGRGIIPEEDSNQLSHNKWVDAKEIKAFWTQIDFFKFRQIRYDLSHGDLHPPLYFWILHIWSSFQSVNAHTGPQLSLLFYSITAILIFLICLSLKCRPYIATSMSILWLLNGSIVSVALETRQYGLLSLVSSLYLLSMILFLQKKTNKSLAFVSLSAMLGMLTHYHFALLIVVSMVYIGMYLFIVKKDKILLFKFIIAFIIAGIFFVLLHPDFYLSFMRQQHMQHSFSIEAMNERKLVTINTFQSLLPSKIFDKETILLGFKIFISSAFMIYFYRLFKNEEKLSFLKKILNSEKWLPLILLIGVVSIISWLYIYQYSPGHAMSTKYLMLVTPFLFIVLGLFINNIISNSFGIFMIFSVLVFQVLDTKMMVEEYRTQAKELKNKNALIMPKNIPLVIDTVVRGVLPRILWHTEDDLKVYVSSQINLIHTFPKLTSLDTFLYVSNYSYSNRVENQKKIIDKFKEKGFVIKSIKWDYTNSKFFLFTRKEDIN